MMIHDLIKIKYVSEGYMQDWPYHLLSDEEMFNAFLNIDETETDFFHDYYPLQSDSYLVEYTELINFMRVEIGKYLSAKSQLQDYTLPNWIYSYMLGKVIGPKSPIADRHELLVAIQLDNLEDTFNRKVYKELYDISTKCVNQLRYSSKPSEVRPPTIFGEPHILKYLRLRKSLVQEV